MNTPVKFEIAKLLKEKGFEQKERPSYLLVPFGECTALDTFGHDCDKLGFGDRIGYYIPDKTINAPTIAEVVMWLYEKHEIWIVVSTTISKQFIYKCIDMSGETSKRNYPTCVSKDGTYYNSPTEAYSQAIEYTLKNLI